MSDKMWPSLVNIEAMEKSLGTGEDICVCGDRRRDHHGPSGACIFNKPQGAGHHGAPDCTKFQPAGEQ